MQVILHHHPVLSASKTTSSISVIKNENFLDQIRGIAIRIPGWILVHINFVNQNNFFYSLKLYSWIKVEICFAMLKNVIECSKEV